MEKEREKREHILSLVRNNSFDKKESKIIPKSSPCALHICTCMDRDKNINK